MTNPKLNKIKDFLLIDDAFNMLKVIDRLNPIALPTNRLCTIKEVSTTMGLSLKDTWDMINIAGDCGLVAFYGGVLSRKRIDLTEDGEKISRCNTPNEIREVLNGL